MKVVGSNCKEMKGRDAARLGTQKETRKKKGKENAARELIGQRAGAGSGGEEGISSMSS